MAEEAIEDFADIDSILESGGAKTAVPLLDPEDEDFADIDAILERDVKPESLLQDIDAEEDFADIDAILEGRAEPTAITPLDPEDEDFADIDAILDGGGEEQVPNVPSQQKRAIRRSLGLPELEEGELDQEPVEDEVIDEPEREDLTPVLEAAIADSPEAEEVFSVVPPGGVKPGEEGTREVLTRIRERVNQLPEGFERDKLLDAHKEFTQIAVREGQISNEQFANEAKLLALKTAYVPTKAALGGLTFGIGDGILNVLEQETGERITLDNPVQDVAAATLGLFATVFTGVGVVKKLSSLAARMTTPGITRALFIREGSTLIQAGTRNISTMLVNNRGATREEKIENAKFAATNIAQAMIAGLVSFIPEQLITPGKINAISQVTTDLVFDVVADLYVRGRGKDFTDKEKLEWFIYEEIPQLALSATFATADLIDKEGLKASQEEVKASLASFFSKASRQSKKNIESINRKQVDNSSRLSDTFKETDGEESRTMTARTAGLTVKNKTVVAEADKPKPTALETVELIKQKAEEAEGDTRDNLNRLAEEENVSKSGSNQKVAESVEAARVAGSRMQLPEQTKFQQFSGRVKASMANFQFPKRLEPALKQAGIMKENTFNAFMRRAENFESQIKQSVKKLKNKDGREAFNTRINLVLDGNITVNEFRVGSNLSPKDPLVRSLDDFVKMRESVSEEIALNLEKQGEFNLANIIRLNRGRYVTKMYQRFVLGDTFKADQEDIDIAVNHTKNILGTAVRKFATRLGGITKEIKGPKDVEGIRDVEVNRFMDLNDDDAISGLTINEKKVMVNLRKEYRGLRDLIDDVQGRGWDDAMERAAIDTVDGLLGKVTSPGTSSSAINLMHFKKKDLDPIFQSLFKEIEAPGFRARSTIEIQGNILTAQTMINKVTEDGAGKWYAANRNKELGLTTQLSESKKFGQLSGQWVNPELAEFLSGGPKRGRIDKAWRFWVGYVRAKQLANPGTIGRNMIGNFTQALQSGDAMRGLTYAKSSAKAAKFMKDLAKGDKAAQDTLAFLAEIGVFSPRSSSFSQDIDLGDTPFKVTRGPRSLLNQFGRKYALIDLPFKYASFLTQKARGKTDAEASKHVNNFYQSPQSLPFTVRKMARSSLNIFADYPLYFVDSIRFTANAGLNAVRSARNGDAMPLIGFTMARMFWGFALNETTEIAEKAWNKLVSSKVFGKKEDDKSLDVMKPDQINALREFLPSFWGNSPLSGATRAKKDGTKFVHFSPLAGRTAFPAEEMIVAAFQKSLTDETVFVPGETAGSVARELLGIGILPSRLYKLFTGVDLQSGYEDRGLVDNLSDDGFDADATRNIALAMGSFTVDMGFPAPQSFINLGKRLWDIEEDKAAGKAPTIDPEFDQSTAERILATVSIARGYTYDSALAQKVYRGKMFRLKEVLDRKREPIRTVERELENRGAATPGELNSAVRAYEQINELNKHAIALTRLHRIAFPVMLSQRDYEDSLVGIGFSRKVARAIFFENEDGVFVVPEVREIMEAAESQ